MKTAISIVTLVLAIALPAMPQAGTGIVGGGPNFVRSFPRIQSMTAPQKAVAMGDVNGDGTGDLAFGNPNGGPNLEGTVWVVSGATNTLLWNKTGTNTSNSNSFGRDLATVQDVDGDGVSELLTSDWEESSNGLWKNGAAYLFSGATGSLIWKATGIHNNGSFGGDVGSSGALALVGASSEPGGGAVHVLGVATGAGASIFSGNPAFSVMGNKVEGIGDLNNDGIPDYLAQSGSSPQRLWIYSGANNSLIRVINPPNGSNVFGNSIDGGADLDGDGISDVIATEGGIQLHAFSGANGALLWTYNNSPLAMGGIATIGDMNGDGIRDIAFGGNTQSSVIISGSNGTVVFDLPASQGAADTTDLNRDGRADFILYGQGYIPDRTDLWERSPYMTSNAQSVSAASGGSIQFNLNFPPLRGGANYAFLVSASGTGPFTIAGVQVPLTNDWLLNYLVSGAASTFFSNPFGVLSFNWPQPSQGTVTMTLPPGLAIPAVGLTLHMAAVSYGYGQVYESSVAVPLTIVP